MIINPFLIKPTPYLYALSIFFVFFLFSCDSKKQVRPDVLAPSNPDSSATVVINFLNRKPTRYPIKLRISSPERKTTYRELTQQGQPYKINIKEELDIPVEDKNRENEIIDRLTQLAGRNLSEEQLIRIFTAVFKSSKQVQK